VIAESSARHTIAPGERLLHVVQGEYKVSAKADVILTTILGSCVAACIRDPVAGVGGMNHFLLPDGQDSGAECLKYGVHSMELLINGLLQHGALRSRLEAKVFGGACVVQGLSSDIGAKNAEFSLRFLQSEKIPCIARSLGGEQARRIRFWPVSGRASLHLLAHRDKSLFEQEQARSAAKPAAGEVVLF
jgi:chemotaxis protein CheD